MGRIKSKAIKRTAKTLIGDDSSFTSNFEENKSALKPYTLPDKGTRNKIAGYITKLKRDENAKKEKLAEN